MISISIGWISLLALTAATSSLLWSEVHISSLYIHIHGKLYPKQLQSIHFAGVCVFSGNQSYDLYATSWNIKIKPIGNNNKNYNSIYCKWYKNNPDLYVLSQGDKGGERVLQKKWTTFLKAQLLCSLPDDGFPFNIIQDMFVLTPSKEAWKSTVFYGVFTSQW